MNFKETWKNHILNKEGKIELIPTDWVWKYRGMDVSEEDLNALQKEIEKDGLYDPLIMRVGVKNKKFRLEAGNHRIQIFHNNKIEKIPVTIEMRAYCGPEADGVMNDGHHNFDFDDTIIIPEKYDDYMKPSEIFKKF